MWQALASEACAQCHTHLLIRIRLSVEAPDYIAAYYTYRRHRSHRIFNWTSTDLLQTIIRLRCTSSPPDKPSRSINPRTPPYDRFPSHLFS